MATYKRIYEWNDLPAVPPDEAPETYALDFKAQHKKDPAEHAKDMAAFANAYGGVLLVGVSEKADNYERCLLPVDEAKQAAKDYEDGARNLLAPRLLVDPVVIEFPGDPEKALVGVNVDPFPGQLVGAKVPNSEAWRFPIRTATRHTTYLDPERAMIYADPKTRKAAILLASIPADATVMVQVRLLCVTGSLTEESDEVLEGRLNGVDPFANSVDLGIVLLDRSQVLECVSPLEDIEAAWKVGPAWVVRVTGCIQFLRAASNAPLEVAYRTGAR